MPFPKRYLEPVQGITVTRLRRCSQPLLLSNSPGSPMMSVAVSSSPLLRTVFMALKPSPTVWVPAGARPGKDIDPERGHLAGPGRAAGGIGTCFITKIDMMIISKKGTGSMSGTGIESGTGTTEKGVWLEANVFLMDLHLLTLIRTKGRRPLHPSPFLQAPNPLQTPREYPLPYRIEGCLAALPIPHLLFVRGTNLKTSCGWEGWQTGRKHVQAPGLHREWCSVRGNVGVSESPGVVQW